MDDFLRVCLERTVALAEVRLRLRDWPGFGGPLVHIPDPLAADDGFVEALATGLAPRIRVLSLKPRGSSPYQVDAADLLAVLDQFGFEHPVLVAEQLGCLTATLVAAWHPERVAGLVLIKPRYHLPATEGIEARALRDCPPNWPLLRGAVRASVLELADTALAVQQVEAFLLSSRAS